MADRDTAPDRGGFPEARSRAGAEQEEENPVMPGVRDQGAITDLDDDQEPAQPEVRGAPIGPGAGVVAGSGAYPLDPPPDAPADEDVEIDTESREAI